MTQFNCINRHKKHRAPRPLTSFGLRKSSASSSVAEGRLSWCWRQASMKEAARLFEKATRSSSGGKSPWGTVSEVEIRVVEVINGSLLLSEMLVAWQ